MQKLLANKRILTPIGALAALAVICLCVGSLLLTLDYRSQLADTRDQGVRTEKAYVSSQNAAYHACMLRNSRDHLVSSLEQADADEQASLLAIEQASIVRGSAHDALIKIFQAKLAADKKLLTVPPVDCSSLKPKNVTSSSRGR